MEMWVWEKCKIELKNMENKIVTTEQLQNGLKDLQIEVMELITRFEKQYGNYPTLNIATIVIENNVPMSKGRIVNVKCTVEI